MTLKEYLPNWLRLHIFRIWLTLIGVGLAFCVGNVSGHSFDVLRAFAPVRLWAVPFFLCALGMLVSQRLQRIDLMRWSMTVAAGVMSFVAFADLYNFSFGSTKSGLFAFVSYTSIAAGIFQAVYELAKRD